MRGWNSDHARGSKHCGKRGVKLETDVSAEEKAAKKRTWLQEKNADKERQKCDKEKKRERKKSVDRLETAKVVFLFNGLLFRKEFNAEKNGFAQEERFRINLQGRQIRWRKIRCSDCEEKRSSL